MGYEKFKKDLITLLILTLTAVFVAGVGSSSADSGPVAHWKFDETSGTTAVDSSGNNNTGTLLNGPVWTTGKIGGGLSFDGTNDYASKASFSGDTASGGTVSLWVKLDAYTSGANVVKGLLTADGTRLFLDNNDKWRVLVQDTVPANVVDITINAVPALGAWIHLVVTWDTSVARFYVNGVESGTDSTVTTTYTTLNGKTIYLASDRLVANRYLDGSLDDVRIYNRALSASEVQTLYNGTVAPPAEPPAVGDFPPPTNLTATTQSIGSGQIQLAWQKPSSNEVIGYNIYRDGAKIDNVIGANTLSYFDGSLPPSTAYDYFVKAVYLGVEEAALPASNTVSGVSPAYCTGTCVQNNPFTAGAGRTIIDMKAKKLTQSRQQSETFTVSLPAGRYQVYAHSFDAYAGREDDAQDNERWFLVLQSSGSEVERTNATSDLLDGRDEVGSTQVIETELVLASSVNQIKAVHSGVDGGSFDDVGVSAVMFVDMDNPDVQANNCLLVIDKTADKTVVAPGELITYTITATNKGGSNCTGGGNYIYDFLPSQVEYVNETHTNNMHVYDPAYYPEGHYVWLIATTPLVPGEVATADITVQVDEDIPVDSCDGDVIENKVYVTNNQYGDRSIKVYSNSVATVCDSNLDAPTISVTGGGGGEGGGGGGGQTCGGSIALSWEAISGVDSYKLYRDSSILIYSGNDTSFTDVVTPGTTHQYHVVSVKGGNVSENSNTVSAKASDACPPPPNPSSVSCEPDRKTIQVGGSVLWTAIPVPDFGGYQYQWSGDDGLVGSTKSVSKTYSTSGVKRASVDIPGVGSSPDCSSVVNVGIKPSIEEF